MADDWLAKWDYDRPWYHGSPEKLTSLKVGTTITQDRRLAELFSHKPSWVYRSGNGPLKHNGTRPGWLYVIGEPIGSEDVSPHPQTTMAPGDEWLTKRVLRVDAVGPIEIAEHELLTAEEVQELERTWFSEGS